MRSATNTAPHFITVQNIFKFIFATTQSGSISPSSDLSLELCKNNELPKCWKCIFSNGTLIICFTYQEVGYRCDFLLVDNLCVCLPTVNIQSVAQPLCLLRFQETIKKTPGCLVHYRPPSNHSAIECLHQKWEKRPLELESSSELLASLPSMLPLHSFMSTFSFTVTINQHFFRSVIVCCLLFSILFAPPIQAAGLGLTSSNIQQRDMSKASAWRSSPFYDLGKLNAHTRSQLENDDNDYSDDNAGSDAASLMNYKYQPSNPPQQLTYPSEQFNQPYLNQYPANAQPVFMPQQRPVGPPVAVAYNPPPGYLPEQQKMQPYPSISPYFTYYYPPWYQDTRLSPGYDPAYQWRQQSRKSKRRRKNDRKCPKVCYNCARDPMRISEIEAEVEKENDNLQKRFAQQIKPANKHAQPVKALFGYMDINEDGVITYTELENYLLLHNIIMPTLPESDRS